MIKFLTTIKKLLIALLSRSSDTSAKRFIGLWCILFGTIFGVTIYIEAICKVPIIQNQMSVLYTFMGSGLAAFGIAAFTKT